MPLHFQMDSMEGVDPAIAGLYTKNDNDKFVLTGVQNVVHKSKLDDFRNNNVELMNKLETFKDVDFDKIKATETSLSEAMIKLENAGQTDEETLNKLVEARVSVIQQDATDTQTRLEGTIGTQARQLESLILDGAVNDASAEHKVQSAALTDVMLRAKTVFSLVDGKPVAKDANGNKMYGDDGVSELNISGWIKGLIKSSPHLFEPSVTGGLTNSNGRFTGDASKLSPSQKIAAGLN